MVAVMTALAPADPPDGLEGRTRYSETQRRTIDAAMALFADHGVSGTSFQMIADAVGVTKAAIYHQFKSKDAIVLAVAEVGLSPLEDALEAAEQEATPDAQRAALLTSVIDLAVSRRRWVNALQGDPIMIRLLGSHDPFIDLMTRVYSVLMGISDDGPSHRMRIAIVSAAIGAAIVHPLVVDMDDETLRTELLAVTTRLFDIAK
jgi:AcrR family transcriptional regulator